MLNITAFFFLLLITTIELTLGTDCSVKCGDYPMYWCCLADEVCDGYRSCGISYKGYRAWLLVLRYTVPIIFLMIVIIIVACLQHRRNPNGQIQSTSFANGPSDERISSSLQLPLTDAQIINMVQHERYI